MVGPSNTLLAKGANTVAIQCHLFTGSEGKQSQVLSDRHSSRLCDKNPRKRVTPGPGDTYCTPQERSEEKGSVPSLITQGN